MQGFLQGYIEWVRRLLPSPLTIALLLSLVTVFLVGFWGDLGDDPVRFIATTWTEGLWSSGLLVFAVQMMLMLVLGHILALSPPISKLINTLVKPCTSTGRAAALVSFFTMLVALFNWGLGLIFGAILARKVGEKAVKDAIPLNYPLIGAAGYVGLMVWHGGMSGSSLIKIAEQGHLASLMGPSFSSPLPSSISLGETVFSFMNISITLALLLLIPLALKFIGDRLGDHRIALHAHALADPDEGAHVGAERIDHSRPLPLLFGGLILIYAFYSMMEDGFLNFFNPNNINLLLLGMCFVAHPSISSFSTALEDAIKGASGILIQFPLYFGILALMKDSGLVNIIAEGFITFSNEVTYPLFTFFSAGLVNLFVPSGGGQWAIQGPIIIQSSLSLDVPLNKAILAMAYGDQLTNMLQPFWALPLLGITRLKAKDILPYTLLLFLLGGGIFMLGLILF